WAPSSRFRLWCPHRHEVSLARPGPARPQASLDSRRYCLARWLDAAPQGSVLHFRSFAKRHLTRKAAPLADPNRCGRVFTLGKSPVLIPRLSRGQKFLSSGHEAVYHAMEIPLTSHGTPGAGLIAVDKIFVGREVELAFLHDRLEETHR